MEVSKNLGTNIYELILKFSERASKANISTDADLAAFQIRTRDLRFRACGNGVTDNAGKQKNFNFITIIKCFILKVKDPKVKFSALT